MDDERDPKERLIEIALAIADGSPVPWPEDAFVTGSGPEAGAFASLRDVERVVRANQQPTYPPDMNDSLLTPGSGLPDGDSLPAAVHWGPLRVIEKIGCGSYGDVYLAWDPRLEREVALKLLRRKGGTDEAMMREARLMARVQHPNVVTVYGAERIDGRAGIWMEFVRGKTLRELVGANGPLADAEIINIGIALCRGLEAMLGVGLLHRDIKAQNVVRAVDGRIVIMDFGTAQETSGASPEPAGTPLYVAPESLATGTATKRSDVYSLGVLLFYLRTGTFPITGTSLDEIKEGHRQRAGSRRGWRPFPRLGLRGVIGGATCPDETRRFEDVRSVRRALQSATYLQTQQVMRDLIVVGAILGVALLSWIVVNQFVRSVRTDQINIYADLVLGGVVEAVMAVDEDAAQKVLATFSDVPGVTKACLYNAKDDLFTSYVGPCADSLLDEFARPFEDFRAVGYRTYRTSPPATIALVVIARHSSGRQQILATWVTLIALVAGSAYLQWGRPRYTA